MSDDITSIIPIASFESRGERDEAGNLLFRRVGVKFPNEQAFLNAVVELARMSGWLVHHDRDKQHVQGHAGFPDLVLARNAGVRGRVIFAELKMPGKDLEVEQRIWLQALVAAAPLDVYQPIVRTWYPKDWDDIVQLLTAR